VRVVENAEVDRHDDLWARRAWMPGSCGRTTSSPFWHQLEPRIRSPWHAADAKLSA
jgi:hypothetical protein